MNEAQLINTLSWLNSMLPRWAGYFVPAIDEDTEEVTGELDVAEAPGCVVSLDFLEDQFGTLQLDKIAQMDEDNVATVISQAYACVSEVVIYPLLVLSEYEAAANKREEVRRGTPDLLAMTPLEWAVDAVVYSLTSGGFELEDYASKPDMLSSIVYGYIASKLENIRKGQALRNEGWYLYQPVPGEIGYDYSELHWNPIWNDSGPWQAFKQ